MAFSGEHPISTKDNAPSVVGAPSSKAFGINSPALTLEEVGGDFSENLDLGLHISALTAYVLQTDLRIKTGPCLEVRERLVVRKGVGSTSSGYVKQLF